MNTGFPGVFLESPSKFVRHKSFEAIIYCFIMLDNDLKDVGSKIVLIG